MRKKAQGIPMNVLIMAAIALLVLIIMIAIFTGKIKGIGIGLQSCENKGGNCKTLSTHKCPPSMTSLIGPSSCPEKQKCCIPVFNKEKKKEEAK